MFYCLGKCKLAQDMEFPSKTFSVLKQFIFLTNLFNVNLLQNNTFESSYLKAKASFACVLIASQAR